MPYFRITDVKTTPASGINVALRQRTYWKKGAPKPASKLIVVTEHGVSLTLRLADRTALEKPEPEATTEILASLSLRANEEIKSSGALLESAKRTLGDAGKNEIAAQLGQLYNLTLPYLVLGRHGNPVHHTLKVVGIMAGIGIGVGLTDTDLRLACVGALLHDAGFARTNVDKIRKADIDAIANPAERETKRLEAIHSRKAHMLMGAALAGEILREFNQALPAGTKPFHPLEIRRIQEIICRHDDPSIEELTGTNSGEWLFMPEETLLRLHREADRLWMVTKEGLEVDLVRDEKKTGKRDPQKRLEGNIARHHEEGALYQQAFGMDVAAFGLHGDTFYSSQTGFELFHQFIRETAEHYQVAIRRV